MPYSVWETATTDDPAIQADLLEHFPTEGTYYVPRFQEDAEATDRLMQAGPTAFVHVTARDGRPMVMPSIMAKGFVLCLATSGLVALLLSLFPLASYAERVKLATLVGLIAVVAIHLGDVVWWLIPAPWKLVQGFYDVVQFAIMGAVLGKFTGPRS